MLKKLGDTDAERRKHCIRLLDSFDFRGHFCLVFERLEMNLRDLLNIYGKNTGINITPVKLYAKQLFIEYCAYSFSSGVILKKKMLGKKWTGDSLD